MKRIATIFVGLVALAAVAGTASATLRSPQVAVVGSCLQGELNAQGESINVLTDQNAVQEWASTVSNNSTFTIQVELSGNAAANTYGIYNASAAVPRIAFVQMRCGAITTAAAVPLIATSTCRRS